MLLRFQPRRDERAALAFDDVASGLDAGLPVTMIGGLASAGDNVLPQLFASRQIGLEPSEVLILVAAWQSGRAPASLRNIATQRRKRAELLRPVFSAMLYPATLVILGLTVSFIQRATPAQNALPYMVLGLILLFAAALYYFLRAMSRGDRWLLSLPIAGTLTNCLAELPYLEVLHGLYSAGVPLLQAHKKAVAACPVASLRSELQIADAYLQQGKSLRESLALATMLHQETRHLISTGEQAGTLEDALLRAQQRRQAIASQAAAQLSRVLASACYLFGVLVACYVIFSSYAAYFGQLNKLLH